MMERALTFSGYEVQHLWGEGGHNGSQGTAVFPDAMRWLLAAATQGLPRAQIKLAEFYALEAETPGGSVKACGWYLIATANLEGIRLKEAQAAYRRLSDRLTPVQRDEAERFAEDWKPVGAALTEGLDLSGAAAGG